MTIVLTQEQLDAAVWGTGYGSKKHLVNHARSRAYDATRSNRYTERMEEVVARCNSDTRLSFFDSQESPYVLRAQPCARCKKIADSEAVR